MLGNVLVGGVLVVFASIISVVALKSFSAPYLWISLIWVSVLLCAWVLLPRARTAWVGLTVLVCVLAGLEGFSWASERWIYRDISSQGTFTWVSDDALGYVAAKGVAQTETKFYRGKKLYDAVYTMDAHGLRMSSTRATGAKANRPCVLFFGDSYVFGWGLNDPETMPYRVSTRSGEKYRVYNLAFPTHGPQQMLAMLERDLISKVADCAPRDIKHVVYIARPDHVRRAAGLREIDHLHGPRYALGADGSVSYQGQFGEDRSKAEKVRSLLAKSFLYRKLAGGNAIYTRRHNDKDVALYFAIVDGARMRAKSLYPKSEFHVLLWGNDELDKTGALSTQLLDGFKGKGFVLHRVNNILPGSDSNSPEYFMGEFSLHPNAAADDRIADYVVRNILNR